MPISPFDWIIIAAAGFFAITGIIKGGVRELFSLAALLLASIATLCYYPLVFPYIQPHIATKWQQVHIACLCIFLVVWNAVNLVGLFIETLLKKQPDHLDHMLGLLFGGIGKTYMLACALAIGLMIGSEPFGHEALKNSRIASYTIPVIVRVAPYFPDGPRKMLAESYSKIFISN